MPCQNSIYKQVVCGKPLHALCLTFLLVMLCACQHQAVNQTQTKQAPKAQKESATHLPQAKPLSPEERAAAMQASNMAKIKQDKFLSAFLFSGFEESPSDTPETTKPVTTPSPSVESESITIETSHLVSVEVWSIILGDEKIALLAKAQKLGATQLPPTGEWHRWKMAMGNIDIDPPEGVNNPKNDRQKTIIFIAPPDFAKFKNGDHIIVEISNSGGVHLARYVK